MDTEVHSAFTTLLLDDSPLKARLQPYNHVCLREYDSGLYKHDLAILDAKFTVRRAEEAEASTQAEDATAPTPSSSQDAPSTDDPTVSTTKATEPEAAPDTLGDDSPRRVRPHKKKTQKLEEAAQIANEPYDQTLLAIIGILDTMKVQTNVAAWIRTGGLWASKTPPAAAPATKSSDSTVASDQQAAVEANVGGAEDTAVAPGNDQESVNAPRASLVQTVEPSTENGEESTASSPPPLWFEDQEVVQHWIERGLAALEALGIEPRHGLFE